MKNLLSVIPLVAFLGASCQQNKPPVVETLPPVVQKAPVKKVASKPKTRKKSTRTYRKPTPSKPKTTSSPAIVKKEEKKVDPLLPDPVNVTPQVAEIPRFEVPENIQPSVTDGINQAEFIELKW